MEMYKVAEVVRKRIADQHKGEKGHLRVLGNSSPVLDTWVELANPRDTTVQFNKE
jgi:hypothetical protein